MKVKIPEISWHNRDPVLSVDIQAQHVIRNHKDGEDDDVNITFRLASGGTDTHVLIWYITLIGSDNADIKLELAADLKRHQRAVNVVRWSPNGVLLASGDDECVIILWKQKLDHEPLNILDANNDDENEEVWLSMKVLRGHLEDVYDLSWSSNSLYMASASVDNSVILWDVEKGKLAHILHDHKGFVQGVAWDPKDQFIATLSTDRRMRIFDIQTKKLLCHTCKGILPVSSDHILHEKQVRLFHDDTLQTFFRRLNFSPDGKLLIAPAGVIDYDGISRLENVSYVFTRATFRQPVMMLPCPGEYAVAVRFCPLLFKLRKFVAEKNPPIVSLPYRMIFAIATKCSVYFYDTQQKLPFAMVSNIHYTRLTDITWSNDGCLVVASSTDGFCSLIAFGRQELGELYEGNAELPLSDSLIDKTETPKHEKSTSNKASENAGNSIDTKTLQQSASTNDKPIRSESISHSTEDNNPLSLSKQAEETIKNATTRTPTPIAIKRKSENAVSNGNATLSAKLKGGTTNDGKQSQQKYKEEDRQPENITNSIHIKNLPAKSLLADMIVDKEILSSEEKFQSPEKKNHPVTPISIRRHPRNSQEMVQQRSQSTLSDRNGLPSSVEKLKLVKDSPSSSNQKVTPKSAKKPTAIAIRRAPRVVMPLPTPNSGAITEEALDAWPKPQQKEVSEVANPTKAAAITDREQEKAGTITTQATEVETATMGCTEDMRLVYEETVEENRLVEHEKAKDEA